MSKIKIIKDSGKVYDVGQIVKVTDFISDYCATITDKGVVGWLERIPMPYAVNFIAGAWGIEYKFI